MFSPIPRNPQIRKRHSRACIVWALLTLLFVVSHNAVAAEVPVDSPPKSIPVAGSASATPVASTHYETGLALYGLGHFEDAVSEFRKAYEVQARPEFLLHIGRSFQQLGQSEKALYFFKRYISTAPPEAAEREEASAFVAKFDAEHPVTPTRETPLPSAAPAVAVTQTNQEFREPVWQRWWVWSAVGVFVIASVGIGVVLARGADDGPPRSDLGHMRF